VSSLLEDLQYIGVAIRLKVDRNRKSCKDCQNGCVSATGDGWNEPRDYEWNCPLQEARLNTLVSAYENLTGEVDYEFATVCPLYSPLTESELRAESES